MNDGPPVVPAHVADRLCAAVGHYLRRVDAWLFEQSHLLSSVEIVASPTLQEAGISMPFVYPRMQEFHDRSDALKEALRTLYGTRRMPYPDRQPYILSLPGLNTYHKRADVTVRGARHVLPQDLRRTFLSNLRAIQHLTVEVYDVALHRKNQQRRGTREWPNPRENHVQLPSA